jgi:hypothetical protein
LYGIKKLASPLYMKYRVKALFVKYFESSENTDGDVVNYRRSADAFKQLEKESVAFQKTLLDCVKKQRYK